MNVRFACLSVSLCLCAAACSSSPDAQRRDGTLQPAAVADEHAPIGPSGAPARARAVAVAARGPCAAPPEYASVPIGDLLDDPAAYEGSLVQTIAPIDSPPADEVHCMALQCEDPFVDEVKMVAPAGELALEGAADLLPADGTAAALVWGEIQIDAGRPLLVVEGACPNVAVPCGLYGPECPSTMTCVLHDCDWNGGNCGINPPGTCGFGTPDR